VRCRSRVWAMLACISRLPAGRSCVTRGRTRRTSARGSSSPTTAAWIGTGTARSTSCTCLTCTGTTLTRLCSVSICPARQPCCQDSRWVLDAAGHVPRTRETAAGMALVDAQLIAAMRRTVAHDHVRFDLRPYRAPDTCGDRSPRPGRQTVRRIPAAQGPDRAAVTVTLDPGNGIERPAAGPAAR